MTNDEKTLDKVTAVEQMLAGWVAYGRCHLADVPPDAPLCAALPSVSWINLGTLMLRMMDGAAPTDEIRRLSIEVFDLMLTIYGERP